ncbi:hypothetical protein K439DRAFT_1648372 [Ramaria rubella]|nr:hypothetical protein K439DRAFT_1648372 [Ramaria rubella]
MVRRLTGILRHDDMCLKQDMQRLPAVPLHEHVWQVALQQLCDGASITAIQNRNLELSRARLYHGQTTADPQTANVRYDFLPSDSTRLYRKFSKIHGIDVARPTHYNIDDWLNPKSPTYKPELAAAVFHYRARDDKGERFRVCIQTPDMKEAAWKYAHRNQVVLDGTFGICDRRILLFIALGVDETGKGVPLAFFLFSAPTGNRATQAGYDTAILHQLLKEWRDSLGVRNGEEFTPLVAITDTDTKERGALTLVWPDIWLILCKFHIRQCWTNRHKKQLVHGRLRALETQLLDTVQHMITQQLIAQETETLISLKANTEMTTAANAGLSYLKYLTDTMPMSLWHGWSKQGHVKASHMLGIPVEGVIPTTNHLEGFNCVLKRKHIHQWQHSTWDF